MSLSIYLQPLEENIASKKNWNQNTIGQTVSHYNEELNLIDFDIALIGVMEQRGHKGNDGCGSAPDRIREQFYSLYHLFSENTRIVD